MNPEVKAKWLEALRSGKYKQGTGMLRTLVDSFCCLGVLCKVHEKEAAGTWVSENNGYAYSDGRKADKGVLIDSVMDWAGLRGCAPIVEYAPGEFGTLSYLNDFGMKFEEIADLIEKQL